MKRRFMLGAIFASALLCLPASAHARGYYFNKPGVAREAYMADVAECIELAGGARASDVYTPYSPNLIVTGVTAFFSGMTRSMERRRTSRMIERICMADKGYARYEVDNAVLDEIEDIGTEAERLDRLFGLASSASPIGERMAE